MVRETLKPHTMTAIASLDPHVLRKITTEGIVLKNTNDLHRETVSRKYLYDTATAIYKEKIISFTAEITRTAKDGKYDYFIPVCENESEEGYWKHRHVFKDGRIWIDGVYDGQYVTISTLSKIFKDGVLSKDRKARNFDKWSIKRALAWMIARKLARTFVQQKLTVALLKTRINITSEYQAKSNHRSSVVEMYLLRVSWD
jgi:ligand-binding SRPBCC domain-containing protein